MCVVLINLITFDGCHWLNAWESRIRRTSHLLSQLLGWAKQFQFQLNGLGPLPDWLFEGLRNKKKIALAELHYDDHC